MLPLELTLQASTLFTNCLVFSIAPSENLKPEPDTGLAEATGHLTGHHYPSSDFTGGSGNYFKLSSVHSPLSASFGAASGIAINHDYTPALRTVTNWKVLLFKNLQMESRSLNWCSPMFLRCSPLGFYLTLDWPLFTFFEGHTTMVDGMMSSAFAAAAAAHQDSLSRMTSMTNSIAPPQSHTAHTAGQILGEFTLQKVLSNLFQTIHIYLKWVKSREKYF